MQTTVEKIYELVRNLPDHEQLVVLALANYQIASRTPPVHQDAGASGDSLDVRRSHSWSATWGEGESRAFSDPQKKFEFQIVEDRTRWP